MEEASALPRKEAMNAQLQRHSTSDQSMSAGLGFVTHRAHVGARWYARAATSGIPARPICMYVALLCMRVYIVPVRCIDCMRTEGRVDGCVPLFEQRLVALALANAQLSFFFSLFFSTMTINGA